MTQDDVWEKTGGIFCPECGEEVVRIVDGKCPQCNKKAMAADEAKIEDKASRRYFKGELRKGTISLGQLREGRSGS